MLERSYSGICDSVMMVAGGDGRSKMVVTIDKSLTYDHESEYAEVNPRRRYPLEV